MLADMFLPSFVKVVDAESNLLIAKDKPIKIKAKAARTPTAFHNFLTSTKDRAITAAANIAIDPAIYNKFLDFIFLL